MLSLMLAALPTMSPFDTKSNQEVTPSASLHGSRSIDVGKIQKFFP